MAALYVAAVGICGLGVFAWAITRLEPADLAGLGVLAPLAVLAQFVVVGLPRGGGRTAPSTMVYIAGIVLLSAPAAVVLPFAAMLVCELASRRPWYKVVFNAGEYTLSIGAAVLVWSQTGGAVSDGHDLLARLPAAILSSCVYYLLNTWLVNLVLALEQGGDAWTLWWTNHSKDVLPRMSMHVMGILFAVAWLYDPRAILLLLVPAGVTWGSLLQVRTLELKTVSEQQLREKSEQLAARWEALASISAALGEHVGVDEILGTAAGLVVEHCADAARIRTAAGDHVATTVASGVPPDLLDNPDVGRGAIHARTLSLRVGNAAIGSLEAAWAEALPSAEQDALLDYLADRVAVALGNAVLVEESAEVEAMREVTRLKNDFLATVSHELREPLAPLVAYGELLEEQPPPEAEVRWMGGRIRRAGGHLTRLVEDLLEAGRIESGRFSLVRRDLDPAAAAASCVEIARTTYPTHHFALRGAEGNPRVLADGTRLQQVLGNLLSNAARYAPPDTEITVAVERGNGMLTFAVEDQGPGVPEAERDRVFEKFYRTAEAKQQVKKGLGLGLAICHELVAAHGGQIWVEDAPGGGARFAFTLPLAGS